MAVHRGTSGWLAVVLTMALAPEAAPAQGVARPSGGATPSRVTTAAAAGKAEEAPVWKTLFRPGQFGPRRDELFAKWDAKYGKGKWRIAWLWGDDALTLEGALAQYEEGYLEYFKSNPDRLDWLVKTARDVYDMEPSDVDSGEDYAVQKGRATHLQDIAVRRAVKRLGRKFEGAELVQIRGKGTSGGFLSPGELPFHMPEIIAAGDLAKPKARPWWNPGTIEDFYQSNKVLQVLQER